MGLEFGVSGTIRAYRRRSCAVSLIKVPIELGATCSFRWIVGLSRFNLRTNEIKPQCVSRKDIGTVTSGAFVFGAIVDYRIP